MRRGSRNYKLPVWILISLVAVVALSLLAYSCSRRESGRDESPAGPTAPYRLSLTVYPTEIRHDRAAMVMIDVKDGYGYPLKDPVWVCLTSTGGVFAFAEEPTAGEIWPGPEICGPVKGHVSLWLIYNHSRYLWPPRDTPGEKKLVAYIDYGCGKDSYVRAEASVFFIPVEEEIGSVTVSSDRNSIADTDNDYAVITAVVVDKSRVPMSNMTVEFTIIGGGPDAYMDPRARTTDSRGTATSVFWPKGTVGIPRVCASVSGVSDCVEIICKKKTEEGTKSAMPGAWGPKPAQLRGTPTLPGPSFGRRHRR